MKTEKIEKHMRKRTVVVAKNDTDSDWDVLGVMCGGCPESVRVGGLSNGKRDYWMHRACNIRKATDDERAAFFARLVSDGSDLADGFARFGGAPRGFEEWRTALLSGEPAPKGEAPKPTPEPVEPPAPKHKRGDLRVWLRRNGIGAVARVTRVDDDVWVMDEAAFKSPDEVHEPTRENVAMLVAKQRERGIEPELGDLVFVMGRETGGMLGRIAFVSRRIAFVSSSVGAAMTLACAGTTAQITAHPNLLTLVIRRNPLAELGDE